MLPHDSFLSGLHFLVECAEHGAVVRDCNSSNGTWVNHEKVTEQPVQNGDQVAAGQTRFRIHADEAGMTEAGRTSTVMFAVPDLEQMRAQADEPRSLSVEQANLLEYLRRAPAPLYAILNGNVDERVPHLLIASGENYQWLPEGAPPGDQIAPTVYLVHVPTTSPLLPALIQEGWGKHWIVFFTCQHPFLEIRKHLRQYLCLQTDEGARVFYRFYDPRILQLLLPECGQNEMAQLFGPIQCFLMEDAFDSGKLLEFSVSPQGLSRRVQHLR
jgi:pSer/pThr/pTyr-binding forkhead associated (FHA) protein